VPPRALTPEGARHDPSTRIVQARKACNLRNSSVPPGQATPPAPGLPSPHEPTAHDTPHTAPPLTPTPRGAGGGGGWGWGCAPPHPPRLSPSGSPGPASQATQALGPGPGMVDRPGELPTPRHRVITDRRRRRGRYIRFPLGKTHIQQPRPAPLTAAANRPGSTPPPRHLRPPPARRLPLVNCGPIKHACRN